MTQDQIDALNDPYQELTGDGLAKWCKEDCYQIHIICRDESETRAQSQKCRDELTECQNTCDNPTPPPVISETVPEGDL